MEIDPQQLDVLERYKLLIGGVVPRPIAFVSTISTDGAHNLAPFSFFNAVGSNPMTLLFCPANNPDGSDKDSLRNAQRVEDGGQGQFVVNVAVEAYEHKMAATAEPLKFGDSEFAMSGLTPTSCVKVDPPRVAESPIAFECTTTQVIRTNPGAPGGGNIVLGEVVYVHIDDGLINDRMHIDPKRRAIGRMGGREYCRTHDRFELPIGYAALNNQDGASI